MVSQVDRMEKNVQRKKQWEALQRIKDEAEQNSPFKKTGESQISTRGF